MKHAIVTIAIGEKYEKMGEITHPRIKKYAEKINADFIVINEPKISTTTPHWEKFQLLDLLQTYDRIIYIDTDVIIRNNCPNLFEIVPEAKMGMFNECPFTERRDVAIEGVANAYQIKDFKWDGCYYNSGVMVMSKCHRMLFRKPKVEVSNFFEQSYLNVMIQKMKIPVFNLHYKFNRMICMDKFSGKDRYESYIIHYAGVHFPDFTFSIIHKDAEICDSLPDDYVSKEKIWINVQGGMGDQIQAEPTIRFALKNVWKGADIRVSTHFPQFFKHLPIVVKKHEEPLWKDIDSQPFTRVSLPGPETVQWRVVSNLMCHTVDFCSMAVLARTLPDIDKSYVLQIDEKAIESVKDFIGLEGIKNLEKCVLVHAGRHWESKTIPETWWQEIVDGLIEADLIPILIGKDEETRGITKLNARGKAIDLTNLLTLEEYIACISMVPILISNDSSPIHIGGAFDNWIILIPTCKHPDHLLPYRNGTKYYKTLSLYKKIALDDMETAPTTVYGSLADKLHGKWEDYLPDSREVVDKINFITRGLYGKIET